MVRFLNDWKMILMVLAILFCYYSAFSQDLSELQLTLKKAYNDNDTLALSRTYYKLGQYYDHEGMVLESNEAMETALSFAKSIKNSRAIAVISNYLASNYSEQGMTAKVTEMYLNSIDIFIGLRDTVLAANTLVNLSMEYVDLGQYMEALEVGQRALKMRIACGDSSNIATYYQHIGEVYKVLGMKEEWKTYLGIASDLARHENYADFITQISILNDLGGIYESEGSYKEAEDTYLEMIKRSTESDYQRGIAVARSNLVPVYTALGKMDKAIEVALLSFEDAKNGGTKLRMISSSTTLARSYQNIKDINRAGEYYQYALGLLSPGKYPEEELLIYEGLKEIFALRKNFYKAFVYAEKFQILKDSIESVEVKKQIQQLEAQFQTEKKGQQIELLTAENRIKSQENRIILLFVIALMVLLTLVVFVLLLRKRQAAFRQADLQQKLLRSQMNPHFIFNILGSIQNYVRKNEAQKASQYLSQFASLSRSVLEFSSMESITLAKEVEMLKNYVELENMKSGNQFDFIFKMDDQIESEFIEIPPMMVQVFVENSIKHGLLKIPYKGILKIEISENNGFIEFLVEDNGTGLKADLLGNSAHKSRALGIFNQRKKLIEQKCKKKLTFELINLKDINPNQSGVRIKIHLPILNND